MPQPSKNTTSKLVVDIPQEVKSSVLAAISKMGTKNLGANRWAGGNFPKTEEDLIAFLRACKEAYVNQNKSFFIQLGNAMRQKPIAPPALSSERYNHLSSWLVVGWAGATFVKDYLQNAGAKNGLEGLDELEKLMKSGFLPLCFYSIEALTQLHNEILRIEPQATRENIKKQCQRLGLKRPPGAPLVKKIELVASTGRFVHHLKSGDMV